MKPLVERFRGFLPVVVDVETAGFNPDTDALLEIAAVMIEQNDQGKLVPLPGEVFHVTPFAGANLEPDALAFTGIDVNNPLRPAIDERDALTRCFRPIRQAVKQLGCQRAILVGHNAFFDLQFLYAAAKRSGVKRNPFHPFSSFDTVTLAGVCLGETVLAKAVQDIGIEWDNEQAHSALYDAERTAELFCALVNRVNGDLSD